MPSIPPIVSPAPPPLPHGPLARFLANPADSLHAFEHSLGHVALVAGEIALHVVVVMAALAVVIVVVRRVLLRNRTDAGSYVELLVPPEVDPDGAVVFWRRVHAVISGRRLLGGRAHVVFEMAGTPAGVRIGLWAPPGVSTAALAKAAGTAWPGVMAVTASPQRPLSAGRVAGGLVRLAAPEWFGLSADGNPEPLRGIIAEVADCADAESAVVQVIVRAASGRRLRRAHRAALALRAGRPTSGLARALDGWKTKPAGITGAGDPMRSADVRAITAKLADSPGWEVTVRYGVAGPDSSGRHGRRRLRARARGIGQAFGVYAGRNWLRPARLRHSATVLAERRPGRGQLMGTSELAALAYLPTERTAALSEAGAAPVAPPPAAYFGDDDDF